MTEMATATDIANEWIVIGISGVTCGGKTTLANRLATLLSPVHVFHQDRYFFPDDSPRHERCANIPHNNYDILSSLDMEGMLSDVRETLSGADRSHAEGSAGGVRAPNRTFLLMEGFTVLNYSPLMELCHLRYYFVLPYGSCRARRALRLYEPPDVDGYFDTCVWPEHLKYRAEIEKDSRVKILDGADPDSIDIVVNDIKDYIKSL